MTEWEGASDTHNIFMPHKLVGQKATATKNSLMSRIERIH